MSRYILMLILAQSCLMTGGCGNLLYEIAGLDPPHEIVATPHAAQSLLNFSQGREYAARGRYELAREQYLHAYAAAEGDPVLRDAAAHEVQAMDMIIRAER